MTIDRIGLLGVSIGNLTIKETVDEILHLIAKYRQDLRPRYVGPINLGYMAKIHHWTYRGLNNPELMYALRDASICTAESVSTIWLSFVLGNRLKSTISGVDLLQAIVEEFGRQKLTIYLFGGTEKSLSLCKVYLEAFNPELGIVGQAHPLIHIDGPSLVYADEQDRLIVEQINRAAPDLLLLNLGGIKQEIWFERIRNRLHVPVTIGVGQAFEKLTGVVPRTPTWLKKMGLEWLHRAFHEPKHFKSYFLNFLKCSFIALPLILYHNFHRLIFKLTHLHKDAHTLNNNLLFISSGQTVAIVPLPPGLNKHVSKQISAVLDDLFSQDALVLDFQKVRMIDLEGMGLLISLWKRAETEKKQLYALFINGDIRFLLKMHRIWGLMREYACSSAEELLIHLKRRSEGAAFYDAIQQDHQNVTISFLGQLDKNLDYDAYLRKLLPVVHFKECILDFTYCTYVDNLGFNFLLRLKEKSPDHFRSLTFQGLNKNLKNQFKLAKLNLPID